MSGVRATGAKGARGPVGPVVVGWQRLERKLCQPRLPQARHRVGGKRPAQRMTAVARIAGHCFQHRGRRVPASGLGGFERVIGEHLEQLAPAEGIQVARVQIDEQLEIEIGQRRLVYCGEPRVHAFRRILRDERGEASLSSAMQFLGVGVRDVIAVRQRFQAALDPRPGIEKPCLDRDRPSHVGLRHQEDALGTLLVGD